MAIEICGGNPVDGRLKIQGSKNAVLPIMAASILGEGVTIIENCPDIQDVRAMADVLRSIGAIADYENHRLTIDTSPVGDGTIREKKAGEFRASVLLLGSLLSKFHHVSVGYPGGCSIGSRPIDFHLRAFEQMGAAVEKREDGILCYTGQRLKATELRLPFPSVGATENILLASVLAEGTTQLKNAAREPEIVELCGFLNAMGAKIYGAGSGMISIEGVEKLHSVQWQLCSDRIVLLTWAMLVAGCGGKAALETEAGFSGIESQVLRRLGCEIRRESEGVVVEQKSRPGAIGFLRTKPYPGYPTDGQSLLMPVLCKGRGVSTIEEGIFENRFKMVCQLKKMGADIDYVSNRARVNGVTRLHGAIVSADDLRGGAGLLIAGGMAEGTTRINREHFIRRGYEEVVEQLRKLGIQARTC
jgi:UDP-N-acetylglucosamine 1-carboxyvinyltransferase